MAQFEEHILQATRNLNFLNEVNAKVIDSYDWQVTICFYTAVHLVNAHLSKFSLQYRTHSDVNFALNFANPTSISKLPEDEYLSYKSLQSLSRRSRYLVNEKDGSLFDEKAYLTYDKHLGKALKHLDKLIMYFSNLYALKLPKIKVKCPEIKRSEELRHMILVA